VIGGALGAFSAHGLDLRIVREETAGPEAVRGLMAGEFQFVEVGAVPLVQAALEGHDPLILLAAEPVSALYILGCSGITEPRSLAGGAIGVLSETGQTGFAAKKMLARWGLSESVRLAPLGKYPSIFAALAAGEVQCGVLTADYKLAGEIAHGFTELVDLGREFGYQGPVVATTRRLRRRNPDLVARLVAAYIESIRLFKSEPARVVPLLREHLGFVNDAEALAIQRFYAARFQASALPSGEGIARIIESFSKQYAAAASMKPQDVYDANPTTIHGGVT
jgi:ABC-type nitrate/sulfonate/bicarbonate transport system substrate-binding protein